MTAKPSADGIRDADGIPDEPAADIATDPFDADATDGTDAPRLPRLGPIGWLRWTWRQLTSMRSALFLLLMLAVAALPGSTFPQRSIDPTRTTQWITDHPTAGPILDRLGFFEVYASPWFAAIYLLLFISLVGCVLPRATQHWRALRTPPPRPPKNPERLASAHVATVDATAGEVLEQWRARLRKAHYRVVSHEDGTLSAEKGYLKETGNIVFHLALIGVIVGVGIGHLWGWKGDVILPVGKTFANTLSRYDTFSPGPNVDPSRLAPYTLTLTKLDAQFNEDVAAGNQLGMPRDFTASVDFAPTAGGAVQHETIKVNHPLETGDGTVFLLGNGYAPKITVRDAAGHVLYSDATPFLAQDNNYKSVGAVKVAGAAPKQLGFAGLFLPTGKVTAHGPVSMFPQPLDPRLALTVFEGELFPRGAPQSVYALDTTAMTQVQAEDGKDALRLWLAVGETYQLPGGRGSITFDGVERWAGLSIRTDPGKSLTLGSALLALAGLIAVLVVRRRRVFVRVAEAAPGPDGEPRTLVRVGALAKDDDEGMAQELATLADRPEDPR